MENIEKMKLIEITEEEIKRMKSFDYDDEFTNEIKKGEENGKTNE